MCFLGLWQGCIALMRCVSTRSATGGGQGGLKLVLALQREAVPFNSLSDVLNEVRKGVARDA